MSQKRVTGLIVGALGCALLLAGTASYSWWTTSKDTKFAKLEAGIGLGGIQVCQDIEVEDKKRSFCSTATFGVIPEEKVKKSWVVFGSIGYWVSWIAVGLMLFSLGVGAGGNRLNGPVTPARLTVLLSGVAFLAALIFLILKPDFKEMTDLDGNPSISFGPFLHMLGAIGTCVGAVFLSIDAASNVQPAMSYTGAPRQPQPMAQSQPQPQPQPMAPTQPASAPSPACSRCGGPSRYIAQYQRNYCDNCGTYL